MRAHHSAAGGRRNGAKDRGVARSTCTAPLWTPPPPTRACSPSGGPAAPRCTCAPPTRRTVPPALRILRSALWTELMVICDVNTSSSIAKERLAPACPSIWSTLSPATTILEGDTMADSWGCRRKVEVGERVSSYPPPLPQPKHKPPPLPSISRLPASELSGELHRHAVTRTRTTPPLCLSRHPELEAQP